MTVVCVTECLCILLVQYVYPHMDVFVHAALLCASIHLLFVIKKYEILLK